MGDPGERRAGAGDDAAPAPIVLRAAHPGGSAGLAGPAAGAHGGEAADLRAHCGSGGLHRGGRSGLPRRRRPDPPERRDVWSARLRLRVFHLRSALLPQRGHRAGGVPGRHSDPGSGAGGRAGLDRPSTAGDPHAGLAAGAGAGVRRAGHRPTVQRPRSIFAPDARLWLEAGEPVPEEQVATSPRIRVRGDVLARTRPWRFYIRDHPCVSG